MNFGYGYEREFKTFFTQKIKRIDLKERIYSPQKLKFQNETSIQESNFVANFCATVFVPTKIVEQESRVEFWIWMKANI